MGKLRDGFRILGYRLASNRAVIDVRRRQIGNRHSAILMYHDLAVDSVDVEAWSVVRRSEFLRQVDYLRKHYDVVSLGEAVRGLSLTAERSRPLAAITFDDGLGGNAEVLASIVESEKLPVTIFLSSGHIETGQAYWFDTVVNALQSVGPTQIDLSREGLGQYRVNVRRGRQNWARIEALLVALKSLPPTMRAKAVDELLRTINQHHPAALGARIRPMSTSEVKDLAKVPQVDFGGHSHCHNLLSQITTDEITSSVERNAELILAWTGQRATSFAYPGGDYNPQVKALVASAGYTIAVTVNRGLANVSSDPMELPRISVGRYDSFEEFKVRLVGGIGGLAGNSFR